MAFVNLQRLLDLNANQGEAMGQQALNSSGANKALTSAAAGIGSNAGDAQQRVAQAQAMGGMLGTSAGQQAAIGGQANALDAVLAGNSQAMRNYQQRTGNLQKMLSDTQGAAERKQIADQRYQQNIADADRRYAESTQARRDRERVGREAALSGFTNVNKPWRGGYNPANAADYVDYSNYILSGRR